MPLWLSSGDWKTIALQGGVVQGSQAGSKDQAAINREKIVEAAKALPAERVHSELCLACQQLTRLYALRAILSIVQNLPDSPSMMNGHSDVDRFVGLLEKATLVKFGEEKIHGMIKSFVRMLSSNNQLGYLASTQLNLLCTAASDGALAVASKGKNAEIDFEVATNCLKEIASNKTMLSTVTSELLSESGFVQLVTAICGITGPARKSLISVFCSLCSHGSGLLRPRSLHPALGKTPPLPCVFTAFAAKTVPLPCVFTAFAAKTMPLPLRSSGYNMRKLYWEEFKSSEADKATFGTASLSTLANLMLAWYNVPADKLSQTEWSISQKTLLEALISLKTECLEADFSCQVLHVDGNLDDPATVKSLQRFLNRHWFESSHRIEELPMDGTFDKNTIQALQTFLKARAGSSPLMQSLDIGNGEFDEKTKSGLCIFLNRTLPTVCPWAASTEPLPKLKVDGRFGEDAVRALQSFLNLSHTNGEWNLLFRQKLGETPQFAMTLRISWRASHFQQTHRTLRVF